MATTTVNALPQIAIPVSADKVSAWDASAGTAGYIEVGDLITTAVTGGGTIATGGFTLTVPTTMTAAGRNVENTFTQAQTIDGLLTLNSKFSQAAPVTNPVSNYAAYITTHPTITTSGAYTNIGHTVDMEPEISSGAVSSGSLRAYLADILRNSATDAGSISAIYGLHALVGHFTSLNASATTTTVYGVRVSPYVQEGTVTNVYGFRMETVLSGGVLSGDRYGVYIADTLADNFFAGDVTIGGSAIVMSNLPTADPVVAGQLWNSTGTVRVSAG